MKLSTKMLVSLVGSGVLVAAAAGGCSGGGTNPGDSSAGGGGAGGAGAGADPTTSSGLDVGTGPEPDASIDEDSACVATKLQANYEQRPADIIFIIDNSESMTEEIDSVQKNINKNFASIIAESGIDYRVIMISKHGSSTDEQSVCIEEPLGKGSCSPLPQAPNSNPPHFYQYNLEVSSTNSLCLLIDTLNGTVQPSQPRGEPASPGWSQWLRDDSLKVFVTITDDGIDCKTQSLGANPAAFDAGDITLHDLADDDPENENVAGGTASAEMFDAALTTLAPSLFGTPSERNYMLFSFVGIVENSPATAPWPPDQPVTWKQCRPGSVDPGTSYQALSVMTGGLRYPINQYETYDAVFKAIANSVISGAKLECEVQVPESPGGGQTIDLDTVQIEYTPSDGGQKQTFSRVESLEACKASSFYIEEEIIKLCPETCSVAVQDHNARMDLLYGCSTNPD